MWAPMVPTTMAFTTSGFRSTSMEAATHKLEAAQGQQINQRPGVERHPLPHARNYEVKWSGPDGVVLDVSQSGWLGAP